MKKAYLAISYSNRKLFDNEVDKLKLVLHKYNFELFVFVDNYIFSPNQEKEMMQKAFDEINNSDILIAELTTKSIGVGIEVGYAFANKKTIIYIRKKQSEYSTTVAGCASYMVEYDNDSSLRQAIEDILIGIKNKI